jgi:hypothetical protein
MPLHNPQLISRGPSTPKAFGAQDDRALNIAGHNSCFDSLTALRFDLNVDRHRLADARHRFSR